MASRLVVLAPVLLLAALAACGESEEVTPSPGATTPVASQTPMDESPTPASDQTPSPTSTPTPTTPTGASPEWKTYTDPDFGFSIDYPAEFIVESTLVTGTLPPGWLLDLRAVDKRFTEGYPTGQVIVSVFAKDASNIQEWVSKHSTQDTEGAVEGIFYYGIASVTSTEVAGRDAVSLESNPGGEGATAAHSLVFFSGSHVFAIQWYAHDPGYEPAIRAVFDRMVLSFRD